MRIAFTASTNAGTNRSWIASATYMRSIEMQSWPLDEKQARTAPSTVRPRSASSSTSMAFLPPSSNEQSISRSPACRAMLRPDSVEPVNMT